MEQFTKNRDLTFENWAVVEDVGQDLRTCSHQEKVVDDALVALYHQQEEVPEEEVLELAFDDWYTEVQEKKA